MEIKCQLDATEVFVADLIACSTCFGRICAHRQEKQLCLCDTWCLLFSVDDCLVCSVHTRQSSTQNNKYQVSHKHSCFSWRWALSRPKYVEIDKYIKNKYTKNKLCTKLALFTRATIKFITSINVIRTNKMHTFFY